MSRRYTVNSGDYPEHLNPFHEENEDTDHFKNKFNTVGRRKSRAVLNVASWTMFQTKNSKPVEREVTLRAQSNRNKFMTLTPKISRHLMDILSPKTSRSRNSSPSNSTRNPGLNREKFYSVSEFSITPKSSRERFAVPVQKVEGIKEDETGTNGYDDPTIGPDVLKTNSRSNEELTTTAPLNEVNGANDFPEEERKFTKQGAKPKKKKRRAPLPPSFPSTAAGHKQANVTNMEQPSTSTIEPEGSEMSQQSDGDISATHEQPCVEPEGSEMSQQSDGDIPATYEQPCVEPEGSEMSQQANGDITARREQQLTSNGKPEGSEMSQQANGNIPATREQPGCDTRTELFL